MLSSLYFDYKDIVNLVLDCSLHHTILSEKQYNKIWLSRKNDILLDYALTINPIPGLSKLIRKTRDRQLAQWHRDHPGRMEQGIHDQSFDTVRERVTEWLSTKDSYQEAVTICNQKKDKESGEALFLSFKKTISDLVTEPWYEKLEQQERKTQKGYRFSFLKEEIIEYMNILFQLYLDGATESEILISCLIEIEKLCEEEKSNAIFMFLTALNQGRLAYDDPYNAFFEGKTYSCSQGLLERIKDYFWAVLMPLNEYRPPLEECYQKTITDYFNTPQSTFLYSLFFYSMQSLGYGKERFILTYHLKEDLESTIQKIQSTAISLEEESCQTVCQMRIFLIKMRNAINNHESLDADFCEIELSLLDEATRLSCKVDGNIHDDLLVFLRHPTIRKIWHKFIISEKIASIERHHPKRNPGALIGYMGDPLLQKEREAFSFCPLEEPLSFKIAIEGIKAKMSEISDMPMEWLQYILDMNRDRDMGGMISLYEDGQDPEIKIDSLLEILLQKKKEIVRYQHDLFAKQEHPFSFMRYFIIEPIKPFLLDRIMGLSLGEWLFSDSEISSALPCQAAWIRDWISNGYFNRSVLNGIACKAIEIKSYFLLESALNHGADPNFLSADGYPLAILAVKKIDYDDCSLDLLTLLLSKGAFLESRDSSDKTLLHYAVMNNSLRLLKWLYEHEFDSDVIDHYERTALFYFCSDAQLEVIQYLVQKFSIDCHRTDSAGQTPVFIAMQQGCLQILEYLLEMGLSPNTIDYEDNPMLSYFCHNDYQEAFKIALKYNPQLEQRDRNDCSLLDLAIRDNQREIVQLLLEQGADIHSKDRHGRTAVFKIPLWIESYGTENDITQMLKLLEKHKANFHASDWYARGLLYYAVQSNSLFLVEHLLSTGLIFEDHENPLTWITHEKQMNMVLFLMKNQRHISKHEWDISLDFILMRNCPGIAKVLIEYGASLSNILKHTSFFFKLIRDRKSHSLHFLLQFKTAEELSLMRENGYSLLTYAIIHKNTKALRLLLAKKLPLTIDSKDGNCPLYYAVMNNQYKSTVYILKHIKELFQSSILCTAAMKGSPRIVKLLIDHNAPINCVENDMGHTPLSRAIENEHHGAFLLLMHHGADINYKPEESYKKQSNRETPLTLAIKKKAGLIVSILFKSKVLWSVPNLDNEMPLYLMIKHDVLDIPHTVLCDIRKNDAQLLSICHNDENVLTMIFEKKRYDLFRLVIKERDLFALRVKNVSLLEYAIRHEDPLFIEIMFEKIKAYNQNGENEAAALANSKTSYLGMPALFYAIHLNNPKTAKLLLLNGANINALFMNYTPLSFAFSEKNNVMIQMLLHYIPWTFSEKVAWFFEAINSHRVDILRMLLKYYEKECYEMFDINCKNADGDTGLSYSLKNGVFPIFHHLLCEGANPNGSDYPYRPTLFHHATERFYQTSLLHIAAYECNMPIAEALLASGADVNSKDSKGLKPLSIAIIKGDISIIKLLLRFGAHIESALIAEDLVWQIHLEKMKDDTLLLSMKSYYEKLSYEAITLCHILRYTAQYRNGESPKELFDATETTLEAWVHRGRCLYESADKLVGLLFFSVEKNMKNLLSLLITKAPSLLEARNRLRETALEVAIKKNRTEVVDILCQNRTHDAEFMEYKECLFMRQEDYQSLNTITQSGSERSKRNSFGKG